jgi:ammonia channel protein AmtB
MEEQKIMSHFMKGVLISLVIIVLGIAGYIAGISMETWYSWTVNCLMFILIIAACIHYAKQKDGFVTFGNVFSHGFKTSAIIALIMVAYTLLSFNVIFPDMKTKALEVAQQRMESKGNMTDEQIETAMNFTKKYFLVFTVFAVMIFTLIFGLIASVIGAAAAKKKPVNPIDQMN